MLIKVLVIILGRIIQGVVSSDLDQLCDSSNHSDTMETYDRLYKSILKKPALIYKLSPDSQHCAETFPIDFKLRVIGINDLNELSQVMTMLVYLQITWIQKDLSWNITDYEGMDFIWIDSKHIWTPHISVLFGQKDSLTLDLNGRLKVSQDGTVMSQLPHYLSFSCSIDFHRYPFDQQTCDFSLLVLNFYKPEIRNEPPDLSLTDIISTRGEWRLQKAEYETEKRTNIMDARPRFKFTVKRQRTYYVITIIFPMILTSAMIPFVFLIPARTGEKISYLVSIFTSTAIFLNFISDVMPRGLNSMPYLAGLLLEVLFEGFLATLASLIVINKFEKEEKQTAEKQSKKEKIHPAPNQAPIGSQSEYTVQDSSSGDGLSCMTSGKLDIIFFTLFTVGQTAFITVMFHVLDWVID